MMPSTSSSSSPGGGKTSSFIPTAVTSQSNSSSSSSTSPRDKNHHHHDSSSSSSPSSIMTRGGTSGGPLNVASLLPPTSTPSSSSSSTTTSSTGPSSSSLSSLVFGSGTLHPSLPSGLPHPPPGTTASTPNNGQPPQQHCCDSGRPVITDPITGQTICSCQYDSHLLNYQRLAASGLGPFSLPGIPGLPPSGPEGSPFLPGSLGPESAFYANPYASMYHPYEGIPGYPGFPGSYGMDLNGARRKNATRETTSTLKAWLSEHRKNPYPTKGEKIMLAIITKMTLTQVSTWFANARRRLKKENKMTWSPRNRCEEDEADDAAAEKNDDARSSSPGRRLRDDDADSDIVDIEEDEDDLRHHRGMNGGEPAAKKLRRSGSPASDFGSFSDSDSASQFGQNNRKPSGSPSSLHLHQLHNHHHNHHHASHPLSHPFAPHLLPSPPSSHHHSNDRTLPSANKPRIWSVADMAVTSPARNQNPSQPQVPNIPSPLTSPAMSALGLNANMAAQLANRAALYSWYSSASQHLAAEQSLQQLRSAAASSSIPTTTSSNKTCL